MAVTNETINKYGDKFADGSRTLAYAKVTEPAMVNTLDILERDVDKLKGDIDSINGSINSLDVKFENKIDNLSDETVYNIDKLRHDVNTDMRIMNEHIHADDVKLNMIWITIYHIMQIWPLRFLNKIFKWWTYQVITENYLATGEYIFYVTTILRGDKTRKQMNEYTKDFKTRVKETKKRHKKNNNNFTYTIKPNFPDMYCSVIN